MSGPTEVSAASEKRRVLGELSRYNELVLDDASQPLSCKQLSNPEKCRSAVERGLKKLNEVISGWAVQVADDGNNQWLGQTEREHAHSLALAVWGDFKSLVIEKLISRITSNQNPIEVIASLIEGGCSPQKIVNLVKGGADPLTISAALCATVPTNK
ncbi:MAG: hypothetical protein HYU97_10760 [Deltaproteobacteria bacterium]|nr:hypothetical protein [Deltaproteobacteria bacterium]